MGLEARCTATLDGRASALGKAYLETDHLRFSGDFKVRMLLSAARKLVARDDKLIVSGPEGTLELVLGSASAKWLEQIRNPKSLIDKLGVKPDSRIAVLGVDDEDFDRQLAQRGIKRPDRKAGKGPYDFILLGAGRGDDLDGLTKLRGRLDSRGAIWIIYPKGQKSFGEADVRRSALAARLVDTKVVSFSATHTGLRFTIPVAARGAKAASKTVKPPAAGARPGKLGRLLLIHWNQEEAEALAAPLRRAGWDLDIESSDGARGGKAILANPPSAVVVYLRRLPSHGRRTAQYLHEIKAGRGIPIVFVDGEGEALDKTKQAVPGATFTTHGRLQQALRRLAKRG